MGVDDSGTLAALKAHRRELIDPKIAEYGGRIVKTTGDGLLLEFPSVVDAVRCAVDVQRGMAERNAGLPREQRIDFRIGINVGDIIIDGDDIHGDGVNVAARLQALAEPGGICASRVVRDQVLDKLSFTFEDLGAQQVKNIARPVEVYRVDLGSAETQLSTGARRHWQRVMRALGWPWLAAGVVVVGLAGIAVWTVPSFWKTSAASADSSPPLSLAILPFAAPAGSAVEKQYAETLRQDLTTGLAAVRRDVKTVQGDAIADGTSSRELGRRLNVRYLVEGDVRRAGASNIVNLRMVDVRTGAQVWGERYDLSESTPSVESSINLRRIIGRLGTTVTEAETRRVITAPLDQLNATELVLRGDAVRSQSLASLKDARALYDAALRLDPNLVIALIARSDILDAEIDMDPRPDHDRIVREMQESSNRALQLDNSNPQVWRARSEALAVGGRWNAAFEAIDQAIRLDPYNPQLYVYKAMWNMTGRPADALLVIDRAMAMAPIYTGWSMMAACWAHLLLGQADKAIVMCERSAPLEPNWLVQLLLAAAYANHGDLEQAVATKERALRMVPGYTIAQLRAKRYSDVPEYVKLAETYWYPGLRKAGIPEN
jgi:class 3 adenylate cyclase/TolB-like protein/Tfp pilus assembly protein PilF